MANAIYPLLEKEIETLDGTVTFTVFVAVFPICVVPLYVSREIVIFMDVAVGTASIHEVGIVYDALVAPTLVYEDVWVWLPTVHVTLCLSADILVFDIVTLDDAPNSTLLAENVLAVYVGVGVGGGVVEIELVPTVTDADPLTCR